IIELLESIPGLGTFIRWFVNAVSLTTIVSLSIGDFFLGLTGVRPEKKLRVCTVILKDERGNAIAAVKDVIPLLQLAANVYKRDANVRLIPLRPFKYVSGFSEAETVDASWIINDASNSDSDIL